MDKTKNYYLFQFLKCIYSSGGGGSGNSRTKNEYSPTTRWTHEYVHFSKNAISRVLCARARVLCRTSEPRNFEYRCSFSVIMSQIQIEIFVTLFILVIVLEKVIQQDLQRSRPKFKNPLSTFKTVIMSVIMFDMFLLV